MHLERKRAYQPEIKENIENRQIKIEKELPCLPDELILKIFGYLDFKETINVSLVCKNWKDISEDNHLWHNLYSNFFLKNDELSPTINFKKTFKEIYLNGKEFAKIFPDWIVDILGIDGLASLPMFVNSCYDFKSPKFEKYIKCVLNDLKNKNLKSPLIIIKFHALCNPKIFNYAFVIRYYNSSDPSYFKEYELIWINENKESLFLTLHLEPNAQLENYYRRLLKGEFCGRFSKTRVFSGYQIIESNLEQNFARLDC